MNSTDPGGTSDKFTDPFLHDVVEKKSFLISLRAAISRKRQFSVDPGFDTLFIIEEQTHLW